MLAPIAAVLTGFTAGWLAVWQTNACSIIIAVLALYQVLNLLRITENRLHAAELRRSLFRAAVWLIVLQLFTAALWYLAHQNSISSSHIWQELALAQLGAAVLILAATIKNIVQLKFVWPETHYSDHELPTVTVAVPARNETSDLAACLDSIISSDYPKLEILVLDDCSQDKTSDVIRAYAQSGVRFLHGSEPKENWIAKNQAYQQLFEEANGDFILFCGVDTKLGVKTIRSLVTLALEREKSMISVLPRRGGTSFGRSFIQPMRYWWELALPRRLFNRPPVLSTCWMIRRDALAGAGGFKAVSRSVLPESYFAKRFLAANGYSFVRSSGDLTVTSDKSFHDQLDRAVRLRYPELHRRLELTALLSSLEIAFLLAPFIAVIVALLHGSALVFPLALASLLLIAAHLCILSAIAQPLTLASLINFPVIATTEVVLSNLSMLKYEFSTVDWKGRNICVPVLRRPSS